jgi:hypothetical protein
MADQNFLSYLQGAGQSYNPYGTGKKVYGGGRSAPNVGPVDNKQGYLDRDARGKMRRNALLARMKRGQQGRYMTPEWLRGQR